MTPFLVGVISLDCRVIWVGHRAGYGYVVAIFHRSAGYDVSLVVNKIYYGPVIVYSLKLKLSVGHCYPFRLQRLVVGHIHGAYVLSAAVRHRAIDCEILLFAPGKEQHYRKYCY